MIPPQAYQRHLPHQVPPDTPLFLSWNLKGAVTRAMLDALEGERQRLQKQPPRKGESGELRERREQKLLFDFRDRALGVTRQGAMHLAEPQLAQVVEDAILFGVPARYDLYAYVVMGNHVHALLTPNGVLAEITKVLKGYTSYRINQIQGQTGRVFWQDETYDHWVRDDESLVRIIEYIEKNPVVAGLCATPEDWPWSSAPRRPQWEVGKPMPVLAGEKAGSS